MKLYLSIILGFILIGSINFADAVYTPCHQDVDNDDSLTYSEKTAQKNLCDIHQTASVDTLICHDTFGFTLKTTDSFGMYYDQVLNLGSKLHVSGTGACNSDVELKLEKNGSSSAIDLFTTHAFTTGQYSKEYTFPYYTDEGKYTLTATKQSTGEEHVLNFAVKSMIMPQADKVFTVNDIQELIAKLDQRLSYIEYNLVDLATSSLSNVSDTQTSHSTLSTIQSPNLESFNLHDSSTIQVTSEAGCMYDGTHHTVVHDNSNFAKEYNAQNLENIVLAQEVQMKEQYIQPVSSEISYELEAYSEPSHGVVSTSVVGMTYAEFLKSQ